VSGSDIERIIDRLQDVIAPTTGTRRGEAAGKDALAGAKGLPMAGEFASREVTILIADLRGFTAMSEDHPADVMIDLLNDILSRMIEVIYRHGGTVDKFMGDSIMVVFGAHDRHEHDARRAVACAVEMQIVMEAINRQIRQKRISNLYLGIGINTGTVLAGMLGSKQYSEFTVIGREVNLASRIEAFSLRGQVLISESTYHKFDKIECGEPMNVYVKGRSTPALIREVLGIPALGLKVPRQDVRRSRRVKVNIPFAYQLVRNKIIMPERLHGTVLNIGYSGVLAELAQPLDRYSEIRLEFDLSLIGHIATDIYARAVTARVDGARCLTGIEFTSVGPETDAHIKHFIQLLIQGGETQ
jgi:adenylate cyclase